MKKRLLIGLSILGLTACGGEGPSSSVAQLNDHQRPSKIYAIDSFSGEYDIISLLIYSAIYVNYKTYSFDLNKNFFVEYSGKPIFKTEKLRSFLTEDSMSTTMPPQLHESQFLIGENAEFDGENLHYTVSNYVGLKPLTLSWKYKKIDVSGLPIKSDKNNPMHSIRKSPTAETMAAILGIGYGASNTFPEGSVCWQKQVAESSQEYIEFYSEKIIRHVNEDSEIQRSGQWNNITWVQFKTDSDEPERANVKLNINDKEYWGIYHPLSETFAVEMDNLACDYMNETAFKAAMFSSDILFLLKELNGEVIWEPHYL
ncbi:hypothetical protein [Acinetobacter colistiniresistens]|uniref:hypothetical protein n=2 Tax=Acinetobacter TaxID=469 RepID=UPI000BDF8132|nr:hypothetical protein [Acinetobacter colistiniresistens]